MEELTTGADTVSFVPRESLGVTWDMTVIGHVMFDVTDIEQTTGDTSDEGHVTCDVWPT